MKLGTGCFKRLVPFAAKVVSCCASYLRMKAQAARGGEELQDVVPAASAVISVSDLESIPSLTRVGSVSAREVSTPLLLHQSFQSRPEDRQPRQTSTNSSQRWFKSTPQCWLWDSGFPRGRMLVGREAIVVVSLQLSRPWHSREPVN